MLLKTAGFVVILTLIIHSELFAQAPKRSQWDRLPKEEKYDLMVHAARRDNTLAWLSLIGGAGLSVVGLKMHAAQRDNGGSAAANTYVVGASGVCLTLGSIPLFLSAAKSKREARLLLTNEGTGFRGPAKSIPGVGVRVAL